MIALAIISIIGCATSMFLVERHRRGLANPELPWATDRWRRRIRHNDNYVGRHQHGKSRT